MNHKVVINNAVLLKSTLCATPWCVVGSIKLLGTVIRGTPMLLNPAGKRLQNKPYPADEARFKSGPRLPRDATSSEPCLGLGREQ
jgi:hypothetical protein